MLGGGAGALRLEVFRGRALLPRLTDDGGRSAVGEGPHGAHRGVGGRRSEVQRAARAAASGRLGGGAEVVTSAVVDAGGVGRRSGALVLLAAVLRSALCRGLVRPRGLLGVDRVPGRALLLRVGLLLGVRLLRVRLLTVGLLTVTVLTVLVRVAALRVAALGVAALRVRAFLPRRHLVAPGALGARQQELVFLGGRLGEVGVGTRRGDARLFHRACALRQSLARDLAGVGHAYPSPIGWCF